LPGRFDSLSLSSHRCDYGIAVENSGDRRLHNNVRVLYGIV
jgi:hypothetical protein